MHLVDLCLSTKQPSTIAMVVSWLGSVVLEVKDKVEVGRMHQSLLRNQEQEPAAPGQHLLVNHGVPGGHLRPGPDRAGQPLHHPPHLHVAPLLGQYDLLLPLSRDKHPRPHRITLCRFPLQPVMPRNHLHLVLHHPPSVHGQPQPPTQHAHQLQAAAPTLIHQAPAALPLHPVGDGGHERGLVFSPS